MVVVVVVVVVVVEIEVGAVQIYVSKYCLLKKYSFKNLNIKVIRLTLEKRKNYCNNNPLKLLQKTT